MREDGEQSAEELAARRSINATRAAALSWAAQGDNMALVRSVYRKRLPVDVFNLKSWKRSLWVAFKRYAT